MAQRVPFIVAANWVPMPIPFMLQSLCSPGREEGTHIDLRTDQGRSRPARARANGTRLGNPSNPAQAAAKGRQVAVAEADRFAGHGHADDPEPEPILASTAIVALPPLSTNAVCEPLAAANGKVSNVRNL